MSARLLCVVLSPLPPQGHAHSSRSLTFASDNDHVEIGRSSKREMKNLLPAVDNAWFDSRVMSRNHARLSVSMEKGALFIRDGGSMHGTQVNETKITPDQDVEVHNGDLLTFGSDVTRGAETFPPLTVSCHFYWADPSYELPSCTDWKSTYKDDRISRPKTNQSTNTFTVPDDDDDNDVIEVVHDSVPAKAISLEDDDSSEEDSDVENRESIEESTPTTSPVNKELHVGSDSRPTKIQLEVLGDNSDSSNGASHSPIVLDKGEPLATPRMTPPSVLNTSGEPYENANTTDDVVDRENRAPSMPSCPAEDYINEIEIEYSDQDDDVSNDDGGGGGGGGGGDFDDSEAVLPYGFVSGDEYSEMDDQSDGACSHIDHMDGDKADGGLPLANDNVRPSKAVDEKTDTSFVNAGSILQQLNGRYIQESSKPNQFESFALPPRTEPAPVSPLQPNSILSAARPPSLSTFPCSGWTHQTIPEEGYAREEIHQVKPQESQHEPHLDQRLGSRDHTNAEPSGNGHAFTAENQWPQEFELKDPEQQDKPVTSLSASQADREFNTRVSIADIVDTQAMQGQPPKRKIDDMNPEESLPDSAAIYTFDANPTPLDDDSSKEAYSQDAQPQPLLDNFNYSTQASGMHTIIDEMPAPAPEEERPSKRVKLSEEIHGEAHRERRGRGFVSHAATAIVGALVGGVGTVALLASLPPDYFS